jgi:predicted nucleotidyltransferase
MRECYPEYMVERSFRGIQLALKKSKKTLSRRYKVRRIGVFGSWAKGNAKPKSDIDVLVELSEPIGLELIDLKDYLETLLGRDVDLVTVAALRASMRDAILAEVVYV